MGMRWIKCSTRHAHVLARLARAVAGHQSAAGRLGRSRFQHGGTGVAFAASVQDWLERRWWKRYLGDLEPER